MGRRRRRGTPDDAIRRFLAVWAPLGFLLASSAVPACGAFVVVGGGLPPPLRPITATAPLPRRTVEARRGGRREFGRLPVFPLRSTPPTDSEDEGTRRSDDPPPVANDDDDGSVPADPRDSLGRQLRGLQSTGMKESVEPGDTVVCKRDVPSAGIVRNGSYELVSIYAQAFDAETQTVRRTPLKSLDEPVPRGHDRYITLYSPAYHEDGNPVVVSPEEVGLASVRSEVLDSLWLAVPGFFWLYVCFTFYGMYQDRGGGSFVDALLGR